MTTHVLNTPVEGLKYQAKQTENGGSVFVKNAVSAYVLTDSACTEVTDVDYPSYHTYSVTITRSGSVATVTTTPALPGNFGTGETYPFTIAGADQEAYNGDITGTITGASTFTYPVSGAPATPATGTITAVGGASTVQGCVFLDHRMYVQRTTGEIVGSDSRDVTAWNALNFVEPGKESSLAVAVAKCLEYLVAFKTWDTEFYTTDTTIAAPASVLTSAGTYLKLGCASAGSIAEFDGGIVFMSRRDQAQRGREIHVLNGISPKLISTPEVERILNGDDLADVRGLWLATAGHQFYVLTLVTSDITIVYDFKTGIWSEWSFLTAQSPVTVTTVTSADGIATVTKANHGRADGAVITHAGANQAAYNVTDTITYVDANTYTYPISGSPASPATGTITATGYDEGYFPFVAYAQHNNLDLVLHETNGKIYALEPEIYTDDETPILTHIRTAPMDGGSQQDYAFIVSLALVGDLNDSTAMIRYSDDDGNAKSEYRRVDLSVEKDRITRCGSTIRRSFEVLHVADTALRLESLEMEVQKG